MYSKYVEALAQTTGDIFQSMTGQNVLSSKVAKREFDSQNLPVAQFIAYEGRDTPLKGHFVLGFTSNEMAVDIAAALAKIGFFRFLRTLI